jgi:hypothetical protein
VLAAAEGFADGRAAVVDLKGRIAAQQGRQYLHTRIDVGYVSINDLAAAERFADSKKPSSTSGIWVNDSVQLVGRHQYKSTRWNWYL